MLNYKNEGGMHDENSGVDRWEIVFCMKFNVSWGDKKFSNIFHFIKFNILRV